ncbi:MAG: SafA/ExsA family spore coat assembly protein [Oscillibacter sp.]|nr:SafA/ExsA family spore coat assembly protein [Oscillibacter sp.]
MREEPRPDYVRYTFEFWEDWSGYDGSLKVSDDGRGGAQAAPQTTAQSAKTQTTYVVRKGDTLWAIAKRYGVTLSDLIAANPQIKNPNLIYPGNEVKIP